MNATVLFRDRGGSCQDIEIYRQDNLPEDHWFRLQFSFKAKEFTKSRMDAAILFRDCDIGREIELFKLNGLPEDCWLHVDFKIKASLDGSLLMSDGVVNLERPALDDLGKSNDPFGHFGG